MQTVERIRILDDATIAQIAAGEVIERPVSVVKELVENSLDAGASYVAVELAGGGRREIVVNDDGRGMAHDELPLALQRHATSKLTNASDLFAVRTLGFRGEGLASVAAAAGAVEVVSRASGQNFGARITVRAGHVGAVTRVAASPGTKVTVRDLFSATPVRRDFMGSDKVEFARVSAFLSRIALAWPNVAFSLRHDGRDVWSLPAVADPVERLEMVFGKGSRGSLATVRTSPNIMIGIVGFTSRLGADRPNRQGQVLFVNGRLVRNPSLSAAWSTAYAGKLMNGRYPYGVLMISLAPGDVDVNVHPTKIEVRFASPASVFDAVRHAVADAIESQETPGALGPAALMTSTAEPWASAALPALSLLDASLAAAPSDAQAPRALGQIDQTFIVISDTSGLLILDQHAAHERIAFEALEASDDARARSAPLLLPRVVELTPDQSATLAAYEEELAAIGVEIDRFGDDAYRISAVPGGYEQRRFDLPGILDDLAGEDHQVPKSGQQPAVLERGRRRVLATVACHSVVRAHEPLSLQEQVTLYERLRTCRDPQTCPHGRPTMLRLDAAELSKAFKRA